MTHEANKVQLTGFLGKEPQTKQFESGSKNASFTLAIHDNYAGKQGKKVEQTQWHQVVAWGELAEQVEKTLHKGNKIALEGRLNSRNYTAKDGTTRYITEIILSRFEVLPKTERLEVTASASTEI
ncbi:MAG TPA: single-stranded DNA-binding protein [Saprospiraceae bacterium]|nr:single-stranded DNA-binding protein [Saprospiraceae bacterium]HNT20802.1 single-stranded DNA-binding protein [Saprospiraceae bacterium]